MDVNETRSFETETIKIGFVTSTLLTLVLFPVYINEVECCIANCDAIQRIYACLVRKFLHFLPQCLFYRSASQTVSRPRSETLRPRPSKIVLKTSQD